MANFLDNLLYIFQRVNWLSVLDILLVTLIFFAVLYSLRDTQAMVLLSGVIFLVVMLVLFTTLVELPAFSWLVQNSLPALLLAIPVIFGPEIRRAHERLGRAGIFTLTLNSTTSPPHDVDMQKMLGSPEGLDRGDFESFIVPKDSVADPTAHLDLPKGGTHPMAGREMLLGDLQPGVTYRLRVLALTSQGWLASERYMFRAPICPVDKQEEAAGGGR